MEMTAPLSPEVPVRSPIQDLRTRAGSRQRAVRLSSSGCGAGEHLKLDAACCRVWRASADLISRLPPEHVAPRHRQPWGDTNIDSAVADGLTYVTARSCDWHTDWPEVFELLVVRGIAMLHIGPLDRRSCIIRDESTEVQHRCALERGDIIQLWPMAFHRVITRRSLSLLSPDQQHHHSESQVPFKTIQDQEQVFRRLLTSASVT